MPGNLLCKNGCGKANSETTHDAARKLCCLDATRPR